VWGEIIVAATYNAKKAWIKVWTPIWEAKKILKNKDVYFSWVNMNLYINISRKLMKYLRENTLDVRIFSIDEAFVEISGLAKLQGLDLDDYLSHLQKDILENIWIPVSIWVSNTRLKAKIFSKVNKPFWIFRWIDYDVERTIFSTLSFREIPFVWSQTSKKLDYYISYIQDYIDIGYFDIVRKFWKNGWKIWLELRGVSSMEFKTKSIAKSIWRARAFNREMTSDTRILLKKIQLNVDRLCDELHHKWYEILNIELLLIDSNWEKHKIKTEFSVYTADRKFIFWELKKIFNQIYNPNLCYRKTWVFSSQIQSTENKQLSLFQWENKQHIQSINIENFLHDMQEKYWEGIVKVGV
jgi:nucleotidyltransferase/DNA polymerase involved in DNA repair